MSHVAHYIAKNELLIFCLYLKFWEAMFITGMFHCAWLVELLAIIDSLKDQMFPTKSTSCLVALLAVVVSGSSVKAAAVACLFGQGLSAS